MRPLEGIRVLEVAMYGFVPSAGAVLGEWGADVIKVEHAVTGDPQRGLRQTGPLRVEGDPNPNIEHANRGKRSIGLDMSVPEGKEVLLELARRADVFLTSFLPGHRQKFGIDVDDIRAVNPKIIYARGSALGPRGGESVKGGYDMTAFWCRAGTAATITPPGIEGMIGPPGPAYGDTISGTNLAGGIAAALLKRERTGEPSVVDVSLLGSGLWSMGHTVALTSHLNQLMVQPPPGVHGSPINPLVGVYPTADDRYISFVMMQPTKFWADVCRHMDLEDLVDDPRFATVESIAENTQAAVEILREAMAKRTLPERSKLTRSCWNSVWIGTASSSSRRPAPSPRFGDISMPYVASIGTYLPCWGAPQHRVAGDDEDVITLAVEAGRAALIASGAVERVGLVSRDLPLLESSNAAVLLAGLGLDPELEVDERLGGAPATLDAVSSARPRTLIIGTDLNPAGAAAILTAERGLQVRTAARVTRSLPVRTRNATGDVHDYGDPRLLHERGLVASLAAAWLDTPAAVAGVEHDRAVELCIGDPPPLPTFGASASLFALAGMADAGTTGPLVAVEQASLSGMTVSNGVAELHRREPPARPTPAGTHVEGADIPISLAAYERAFEAKTRWEAGRFADASQGGGALDFPPRYRLSDNGELATNYELIPLPRTGTVYTETTVHMPVPGLRTPYSLVIVELDGVGVRALVKVTGAEPGTVDIGDRGRLTLRRVAVRSGVPDYGYMFEPERAAA